MHYSQDALDHAPTFNIAIRFGQALAKGYRTLFDSLLLCYQADPEDDPVELDA